MTLSLSKGQKVTLAKSSDMPKIAIGLGWNAPAPGSTGYEFDLDVSAFCLDANEKLLGEEFVVFYNQPQSKDGAVVHSGDNRTGEGDGDDETIVIDTSKLDPRCVEVSIFVTIYEASVRGGQTFGQVKKPTARAYDANTGVEMINYELDEEAETQAATSVQFGSVYLKNGEWRFNAIGAGFKNIELADIMKQFGIVAS